MSAVAVFHGVTLRAPVGWRVSDRPHLCGLPADRTITTGDARGAAQCAPVSPPERAPSWVTMSSMYGQKFSLGIDPEHHGPLPTHSLNGQTEWITAGNGETTIALPWMNTFVIISTPDAALTAQLAAAVTVPSPIRTLTVADDVRAMSVQAFTQRSATSTYTTTSQPSAIARIVRDLRGASQPLTPDSDCTSDDPVMTTVTLTLTSGRAGSRTYLVALAPCGRVTDGAGAALSVTSALRADVIDLLPDAGLTPAH